MSERFKMTAMETASLTVLLIVVAIFCTALMISNRSDHTDEYIRQADSVECVLRQKNKVNTDTIIKKTKKAKVVKVHRQSEPIERNYLEENAND